MKTDCFNPVRMLKPLLAGYLLICVFMWAYQRHLLYAPLRGIETPATYGLSEFSVLSLQSADQVSTQGWYRAARKNFPTIVYFHGNGGNLGNRAHYFGQMADAGFGVLAVDYRGYGASQGEPSEQGFYADSRALIEYGKTTLHIPLERMVFYGESIGTGVAVQMATEYKSAAVTLQSPYTSITSLGNRNYPWLPVHFLLQDRFDSIRKVDAIQAPLLILHGEKDTVVPTDEGRRLFAQALEPKQAVYYPESGHLDLDHAKMIAALLEFCKKHRLIQTPSLK